MMFHWLDRRLLEGMTNTLTGIEVRTAAVFPGDVAAHFIRFTPHFSGDPFIPRGFRGEPASEERSQLAPARSAFPMRASPAF